MMKIIFGLLLLFGLNLASAQDEVISLNYGNCWYSQNPMGFKIVDFVRKQQFTLYRHTFIPDLKEIIKAKARNYPGVKISGAFEVNFYCSDAGHILSINLFESQPQLIFETSLATLSSGDFSLNLAGRRGFTTGERLGELIYGLQTGVTHEIIEELLKKHFSEAVESTETTPHNFGLIKLKDTHKFEVQTYMDKILNHSAFKELIRYLEPNGDSVYPGESAELTQEQF